MLVCEGVVDEIHQLLCSKSKRELGDMLATRPQWKLYVSLKYVA